VCACPASHPTGGKEHGGVAIKQPKEAARSLRLAVPARASSSRDDTAAGCWRDLERRHGRTDGVFPICFLCFYYSLLTHDLSSENKRNHKTKPHNSFHPALVSEQQQQRRETFT